MHLLGPHFTTTRYTNKKKKNKSKSLIAAEQEHAEFLKRMGVHPDQRKPSKPRGLAQSGRAGALGASGRWFNSSIPDQSLRSDQSFYHPSMAKKEAKVYNGERKLLGIATMHKSNMVPVFEQKDAEDIAKMRRG